MKYDDAAWHSGGTSFPAELPASAGATHIGMFVAWSVLNGLAGELHILDFSAEMAILKSRGTTPGAWLLEACDGKFTDEDLTCDGNQFAFSYYGNDANLHSGPNSFLADYEGAFPDAETLYHVPDSWETFDAIDPVIRGRFDAWRRRSSNRFLHAVWAKICN